MRGKYIVDEKGKRLAVIIEIKDYVKMQEALEELALIRAYDEAIPFEQAIEEIEREREKPTPP